MRKVLTYEAEQFIIEHAEKLSTRKIAEKCGYSRDTVRRVFRRNNIVVPEDLKSEWRSAAAKSKTTFTIEEDEIIKNNYLTMPIKTIGKLINRSFCGVTSRMNQLGLIIPPELRAERKAKGMFRKGQEPPNKGKKMNPEQYEKYKHTFFQKNHIPHNAKKDWEVVRRKDKTGNIYLLIKIPERRKLIYKHVWLWEKENGKVPANHVVVFKDGNSLNCCLENLECISRVDLLNRNSINRYPEELQYAIRLQSAIKRRINKLKKQQK
jgi:hypothetical protein